MDTCPECGAPLAGDRPCEAFFHQMLFWEDEEPARGEVHHLMVLCYYLQHPSRYSPEGLEYAKGLLRTFVVNGLSPQEVRRRSRDQVRSDRRDWKVTAGEKAGAYTTPPAWRMTAADVVSAGAQAYAVSVRRWAGQVFADLQQTGEISPS